MAEGLSKDQYLETQTLLKEQHEDLKIYLKDTFVCKEHCGKRRGDLEKKILVINTTAKIKTVFKSAVFEVVRLAVMVGAFLGLNKYI